jgi:hypothetical protein
MADLMVKVSMGACMHSLIVQGDRINPAISQRDVTRRRDKGVPIRCSG